MLKWGMLLRSMDGEELKNLQTAVADEFIRRSSSGEDATVTDEERKQALVNRIVAIKNYRNRVNCSLYEAKLAIEAAIAQPE